MNLGLLEIPLAQLISHLDLTLDKDHLKVQKYLKKIWNRISI